MRSNLGLEKNYSTQTTNCYLLEKIEAPPDTGRVVANQRQLTKVTNICSAFGHTPGGTAVIRGQ